MIRGDEGGRKNEQINYRCHSKRCVCVYVAIRDDIAKHVANIKPVFGWKRSRSEKQDHRMNETLCELFSIDLYY